MGKRQPGAVCTACTACTACAVRTQVLGAAPHPPCTTLYATTLRAAGMGRVKGPGVLLAARAASAGPYCESG